jgi:hypothetical protein
LCRAGLAHLATSNGHRQTLCFGLQGSWGGAFRVAWRLKFEVATKHWQRVSHSTSIFLFDKNLIYIKEGYSSTLEVCWSTRDYLRVVCHDLCERSTCQRTGFQLICVPRQSAPRLYSSLPYVALQWELTTDAPRLTVSNTRGRLLVIAASRLTRAARCLSLFL